MNGTAATNGSNTSVDLFTFYETAFYMVNGSVGAVFNALVLFIAFKYIDTDDKPRQIIVINMTAADLLMCTIYMLTRPFISLFPHFFCHPYYVIIWTVQLCSTLNLVWLNLDKLLYIQYPLHYYTIVSRNRLLLLSGCTWGILIFIAVCTSLFMKTLSPFGCHRVQIDMDIYLPICLLYAIMILASFIISGIIYLIAHNSTKLEARQRTKMFHRLFFLFSSTVWTFFTCLPYRLLFVMHILCDSCRTQFSRDATDVFFRILVVGTVINPLITISTQRIYRVRLLKMLNKYQERRLSEETAISTSTRRPSSKGCLQIENVALTSNM